MKTVNMQVSVPSAFVTKAKQRIKQYGKNVYLNNKDEFEIELFNPQSNKVLAIIELNGKSIGNGIVLRPGERVFLERYLDVPQKFLFETYMVDKNNPDVANAIAKNGDVCVKFYDEYVPYQYTFKQTYTYDWPPTYYYGGGGTTSPSGIYGNAGCTPSAMSNGFVATNDTNFYSCCHSISKEPISSYSQSETGRIEQGSHSNQNFSYDNTIFNTWWSWITEWKILPSSQKLHTIDDVNSLICANCGRPKKKSSYKFCPHCGSNNWKYR